MKLEEKGCLKRKIGQILALQLLKGLGLNILTYAIRPTKTPFSPS